MLFIFALLEVSQNGDRSYSKEAVWIENVLDRLGVLGVLGIYLGGPERNNEPTLHESQALAALK